MAKTKQPKARAAAARPEAQRICNVMPSPDTARDWQLSDALASGAVSLSRAGPPASVDLRAPWWNVGDQESTGSCVGWSSTEGVARYHFTTANRLAQTEHLSPRFTWMASKETDEMTSLPETFLEEAGTTLKAAVTILKKFGAGPEALLPFHIGTTMYAGDEKAFFATCATRRISAFFNLGKDPAAWRTWLAAHGPILAALSIDASWDNATATKGKIDTFKPATVRGGHAIAVVGYTADKRFIIRNSWNTTWGDKGFGYVSEAYVAAAFFGESYGVTL